MADPLSVAASVTGILSLGIQITQSLVDFYAASKGQKSDVADTTRKLERVLDMLQTLRGQLTDRKFQDDQRDLLKNIESYVQACEEYIRELQTENDKFKGPSNDSIRAAALTATRRLAYPFRQSTLRKLDEDIDETVSHLSLALQALQQKDIGNVQDDIKDTKALLDLVRADQISSTIRHWLRAPDASVEYNKASKKRCSGTGLWLVKGSSFSSWLEKPNSFLWLNGFAGCGKSVLCSTAIQYVFRHRRSDPRIGIAFFFFVFDDESKQDASAMLRALVLQLSSQLNDSHTHLSRLYDSYPHATPSDHALADCLRQLVRAFDNVYIILDALDESRRDKHRGDTLQALVDLRAWSEHRLHLLVTSRDEVDISEVLCGELGVSKDETISMKNDAIDDDIASFISNSLKNDRRLRKWKNYHDQIEKALTERAMSVFRWVECQFTALYSCPRSKRQLDILLASLPRSLDKTYEQMLLSINDVSVGDAKRILTLLCCAKRPLTVPEIIEGIAVELGDDPRLNPDGRLDDEDEIRRVCPGLIEVDAQPSGEKTTVRIAHFSVQEYLESDRICQHAASAFSVRRMQAHGEIACICLTYLLDPTLVMSKDQAEEYPLSLYAAQTWHEHLRNGDENTHHVMHQALRLFQSAGGEFENWVGIWNVDHYSGEKPVGKVPSPVYYASRLGLDLVLSELLSENPSGAPFSVSGLGNAQGGEYGNALQAASAEGHEKVVQLLLEKNADVNIQGGYFGNALQAASYSGNEKVVELLLEGGAYVNAEGGPYGNALQAALYRGREKVVQLLLERGADINAQDEEYGNALQVASHGGEEKMVKMLLERGAHVNAEGGSYGNALQAASCGGNEKVIDLLLEKKVNVNAQGGRYGNALQAASYGGNEKVVKLLIEGGAHVNAQGGPYGTALQAAAVEGHERVVQLLLDKNADVNGQGGPYGNALQAASVGGNGEVVDLLLEKSVNVNAQGGEYGNALEAASYGGHEKIIQLLLNRGADINAQGGEYGNALQAASAYGHEKVVELLLNRGANVNAQGGEYGNALQAALAEGHEKVVQLLLDKNVDVHAQGGPLGNALQAASVGGNEKLVQLLLEKDVDVNTQGGDYGNALQAASACGHEKVVQLLLDWGADVTAQGGEYEDALQAALAKGHEKVVQLLVERVRLRTDVLIKSTTTHPLPCTPS